jgi:hypothetical protein
MDDEAASQQLMSEARAVNTTDYESSAIPFQLDGASQDTIANTPGPGKKKMAKPRRKQPATSQPASYSLAELQAFVGPSPSKSQAFPSTTPLTQIEVPDTQMVSQADRVPHPTPLTSRQAAETGTSTKRSKKAKKNIRTEDDTSTGVQAEPTVADVDADVGATSSAPKARKPRRKEPSSTSQTKHADTAVEHDTVPATPYEEAVEGSKPALSEGANHSQASRKRRRKDKTRTSVNSMDLQPAEIIETPAATREKAPDTSAGSSIGNNGFLDGEERPLTPKALLSNLKAERSKKSQSADKASKLATAQQHAQDTSLENAGISEQHVNGHTSMAEDGMNSQTEKPGATDAAAAVRTPATTQSVKKRRRTKNGIQVTETPILDWEAPVRNFDETPAQPFTFEDSENGDRDGIDGLESSKSRRKRKSLKGSQRPRPSIGGVTRTPGRKTPSKSRADPNRNYQRARDDDERTAADRALEHTHELGQPPDKRTSGDFTSDEKELLRRAIRDYQERTGLDTADLVEIIHWNYNHQKDMQENTTDQAEAQFKKDCEAFWDDIKSAGLLRKLQHIKKHIRGQYHMCQRGCWSQEEDEQLQDLVNHHPGQWKIIATQLNRLDIDVYNRWKDYVRHGENRNTKRWSQDEEEAFVKVLSNVCQRIEDYRAETGKPPLEDYTPVINWHEVCREMGDTRSRLQCQSKWKLLKARKPPAILDIEIKPRKTPEPGQIEDELPKKRRKSSAKKSRESAATVTELHPPGPDDMLWGDKFDLVGHLIEQATENGCETDDQIVWQDIAEKMNQTWSVRTLQTAYKQLNELVEHGEDETLITCLANIYGFMNENYRNELEDRYNPSQEIEADIEDATQPNSGKKRKRQSTTKSPKVTVKRKRTNKTKSDTQKSFKSKELITESDNAESEPEL